MLRLEQRFPSVSLRLRVAAGFALLCVLASLMLGGWVYFILHDQEDRLIDEALAAELEDYRSRLQRNPLSLPPQTATVRGYLQPPQPLAEPVPAALVDLENGYHTLEIEGVRYRVVVSSDADHRLFMLHSRAQLELRQRRLIGVIGLGVTAIVLLSIAGGGWLAGRVIAPVSELARRVRRRDASELTRPLVEGMPHDEVGELAQVFERYLQRIDAFVQRERAFAADASHELRTPLSIMQGAIEILQADERLLPDVRPRIERMARAVHGMSDLTSALLMLARERADAAPEVSPCPVAEVLRDQVEQHRHLLLHKPVELRLQLEASPQLKVERPLLAIAMGNLIRNAFAYTEQGSVSVRLTASELQVADTGPGIASDAIPGLFEPGAPAVRQVRGAGIGLPLVKRIADRQGWAVFAQNNPNAGALFRLIFTRS